MLKDRGTKRIHFSFLRKQRRSIPASRVSAAEVGASLKSVVKLFLLEESSSARCWLGISTNF